MNHSSVVVDQIKGKRVKVEYVQCDISVEAQVDRMWRGLRERHGKVNVLINNAARSVGKRVSSIKYEEVKKTMEINFLSIV